MTKLNKIRGISVAGLLAVPVMLSGCSLFGAQASQDIDAPPPGVEEQMLNYEDGNSKETLANGTLTTAYLKNENGMLAPVSLSLPEASGEKLISETLNTLVAKGSYAKYIPEGFSGILPAGTEVKSVAVHPDEKLAVVEFNESFNKYDAKDERKILESIVWTLTNNPDVEKVQIWVDGKKLTEMPVGKMPMNNTVGRSIGINLEVGKGAILTNSSPVTVYFSAVTPANVQYYVPVTRLVKPGQDPVEAAIHELISGPQQQDGLEQVLTDETTLQSVIRNEDGTVTVALQEDMFEKDDVIPSELLQSVVLTVAENSNNSKVKIQLNGESKVVGDDQLDYSQPVSRPEFINEISL